MKECKSLLMFLWLLLPTILALSSCMGQYNISTSQLSNHSDYNIKAMKLKSGIKVETNSSDSINVVANNIQIKKQDGHIELINIDKIDSILIEELDLKTTIGTIVFMGIIIVAFKVLYKPDVGSINLF